MLYQSMQCYELQTIAIMFILLGIFKVVWHLNLGTNLDKTLGGGREGGGGGGGMV